MMIREGPLMRGLAWVQSVVAKHGEQALGKRVDQSQ